MIAGTRDDGLPSASSTSPKGRFSTMRKVRASTTSMDAVAAIRCRPSPSPGPQRRRLAITSAEVTGWPSWNFRPSRRVKVQVIRSSETVCVSTICGRMLPWLSIANSVSQIM